MGAADMLCRCKSELRWIERGTGAGAGEKVGWAHRKFEWLGLGWAEQIR